MIKNQLEVITVRFNFRLHEGHFAGWGKDVSRVSLSTSLHPSQEREGIGGQIVEKEGESVMKPEKGYKCGHIGRISRKPTGDREEAEGFSQGFCF